MTWDEVARRIDAGAAAILPIGAAAKQHGLHLPLNTDRIQAEWLAGQMAENIDALIWPTLTYGHYPAFVEYAGSTSLSASTFEAMVREIAGQFSATAAAELFVLDTGISTQAPVERALARLCRQAAAFADPRWPALSPRRRQLAEQRHGSHADELETSLMLALAPQLVDMTRAEASPDLTQSAGRLTPTDPTSPNYSRSGSFGDPTLATRGQGRGPARGHARRSQRAGLGVPRAGPGEPAGPVQSVMR